MMNRNVVALAGLTLISALLTVPPAHTEEGRIPIFEPTTISTPGSYVLTRDVGSSTGPAIEIVASAGVVEIDLNGFTLARTTGTADNVMIADGLTSLAVRNGTIARTPSSPFLFAGLTVTNTRKLIVEDVIFNRAALMSTDNTDVTVRRNNMTNSSISIGESAATEPMTATIEDNLLRNDAPSGNGGIGVSSLAGNPGVDVLIRNNRMTGGSGIGALYQHGCMILGNRVTGGTTGQGISLSTGTSDCLVADNVVQRHAGDGIYIVLSNGNKIFNNVLSNNGVAGTNFGNGIQIEGGSRNHLDGNVVNDNAKWGIWIRPTSSDNTYGRNMGSGNQNPGSCTNPAITTCPAPYGTGSAPPDLCDQGINSKTLCDNMLPGPPRS